MSLRLKHTRRKNFKTKETQLGDTGIPYLIWDKFPKENKVNPESVEGKRIWIAGTSSSDLWVARKYHDVGSRSFPEGGLTVFNKRGEEKDIFLTEAIIHPNQKFRI